VKFISPRIGSIILLLVALLSLSGIAAAAEALVQGDVASFCCSSDQEKESETGPCPVSDCVCASCLTISFSGIPSVTKIPVTVVVSFIRHQQMFPLSEFFRSIDYPPEYA
jgi:hypothetical protein